MTYLGLVRVNVVIISFVVKIVCAIMRIAVVDIPYVGMGGGEEWAVVAVAMLLDAMPYGIFVARDYGHLGRQLQALSFYLP